MKAVLSGRAAAAVLIDGRSLQAIHYDDIERTLDCRPEELRALIGGVGDMERLENVTVDEVRDRLADAVDCTEALDLVLYLLDGELSDDTRRSAAEELAELVVHPEIVEHLEQILFATPLPEAADVDGALAAARETPVAGFVRRLAEAQGAVTSVRAAWDSIPDEAFGAPSDRRLVEAACVRHGMFRALVVALMGESPTGRQLEFATHAPLRVEAPSIVGVLNRWTATLTDYAVRQYQRSARQLHSQKWDRHRVDRLANQLDQLETSASTRETLYRASPSENAPGSDYATMSETLYSLLERSAAVAPAHPAISFAGRDVSYAELLETSGRAAAFFSGLGAAPGARVAFCFRKSHEALIALFGLIRTGATYIPLDPGWPAERQHAICEEAGVELYAGTAPPAFEGLRSIVVARPADADHLSLEAAFAGPSPSGDPAEPAGRIANILYTSGSTGRPKGVQITTESLLHFSEWVVDEFGLTSADRVANHAPYNFDLSTLDIFSAVRAAATMCPVREEVRFLPFQMAKFIADERITVWYSVPSALVFMKDKLAKQDLSALRHGFFAGEVMPKPALRELAAALPHVEWTNLYGPTETNVCTFHRVTASDLDDDGPLPIGRPIAQTRIWIVDERHAPVEPGARGELLVAGPTVTTGYYGDEELTQSRLTPAPDGAGRAYRTGDAVSFDAKGVLQFHGRLDRMLKLRGYRIEPGEIEAALARHPRVAEAAVFAVDDPVMGPCIKACVTAAGDVAPDEAALSSYCRQHLPEYMVPQHWERRAELPRTDRGKIDYRALEQEAAPSLP